MWIIIYSCSFNRVKARPSALWYSSSSRRSGGGRPGGDAARGPGSRKPPEAALRSVCSFVCCRCAASGSCGRAPAVPIATTAAAAGRPCLPPRRPSCSEPPHGPTRIGTGPDSSWTSAREVGAGPPAGGGVLGGGGHAGRASSAERWGGTQRVRLSEPQWPPLGRGVPGATAALSGIWRGGSRAGCAGHRAELGSTRARCEWRQRADFSWAGGPAPGSLLTLLLPPGQPGLALSVSSW